MAAAWTFSDAWFLEPVAGAESAGEARLVEVIAAGDSINHAVFTPAEIEVAVNRLAAAGLLAVKDGRFSLTPEGAALRGRSPSRSVFDRIKGLEQALRRLAAADDGGWRLEEGAYAEAAAEYHRRSREAYRRLRGKPADRHRP